MKTSSASRFIKWFADITIDDALLVGDKNASLGEMVRELTAKGVKVPDGFAITADAYRHFIREAGIDESIRATLADLDTRDMANLSTRGQSVRQTILNATLPADLQELITTAYRDLQGSSTAPLDVAVRSSATAEDLPDASFAGQQETYLNVHGTAALPRSSPTAPSATAWTRASIISRSRSASACSAWCAPISRVPASCSPLIQKRASAMP
jgi:pyruvate,water dikinase